MENRHGLLVDACLTLANGHAERVAALHMIEPHADRPRAITLGADKAYDAEDFVNELRSMKVTPHVAQNTSGRRSAIDGRTTRHGGFVVSQRIRKRIEEAFGWTRGSPDRTNPGSVAATASAGPLPSRPPPSIWCGCRSCWWCRYDHVRRLPTDRPLAASSRPICGIAIISTSMDPPRSPSAPATTARSPSAPCRQPSNSATARRWSSSHGSDSTKWTRSQATAMLNCSTTAPSRSPSSITTATRQSSRPNGTLLQRPARSRCTSLGASLSGGARLPGRAPKVVCLEPTRCVCGAADPSTPGKSTSPLLRQPRFATRRAEAETVKRFRGGLSRRPLPGKVKNMVWAALRDGVSMPDGCTTLLIGGEVSGTGDASGP